MYFFQKHVSEQMQYELSVSRKRKNVVDKLPHAYLNYLEPECIVKRHDGTLSTDDILRGGHCDGMSGCHCISDYLEIDNFAWKRDRAYDRTRNRHVTLNLK